MSEYVPQVGDRVRRPLWTPDAWVEVGRWEPPYIDGTDEYGREWLGFTRGEWEKVERIKRRHHE